MICATQNTNSRFCTCQCSQPLILLCPSFTAVASVTMPPCSCPLLLTPVGCPYLAPSCHGLLHHPHTLLFVCVSLLPMQLPSFDDIRWVSLLGSLMSMVYCIILLK
jgi:hypothetical protein